MTKRISDITFFLTFGLLTIVFEVLLPILTENWFVFFIGIVLGSNCIMIMTIKEDNNSIFFFTFLGSIALILVVLIPLALSSWIMVPVGIVACCLGLFLFGYWVDRTL